MSATINETKAQMSKRHGEEFSALPVFWAFSNGQFHEGIERLEAEGRLAAGEKVVSIGMGGFIAKHAVDEMHALLERQAQERKGILSTYEGAKGAFKYEMNNHEYWINLQADWDTMSCFIDIEYKDEGTEGYLARSGWDEQTKQAYRDAKKETYREWCDNGWF